MKPVTEYLRKKNSTDKTIYIKTPALATRQDMEPYNPSAAEIGGVEDTIPGASGAANATENGQAGTPGQDSQTITGQTGNPEGQQTQTPIGNEEGNPNRITLLVAAIKVLPKESFTAAGKPKVEALAAIVGFSPTSKERDTAWEEFNNPPTE